MRLTRAITRIRLCAINDAKGAALDALAAEYVALCQQYVTPCWTPHGRLVMDGELQAARHLVKLAGSALERQSACGEESAGQRLVALVNLSR
jgi:hypothetical protein